MDRRDIPPEDRYGGGQSYRPGNVRRSPPPPRRDRDLDGYGARSPPRRPYDGRGPPRGRSRSPGGRDPFRRRSPSPRDRFGVPRGGDSYRARPRSPLRRDDGPRDDLFRRDVGRDFRDDRAPARDGRDFLPRSPARPRDRSRGRVSPGFVGRRSPPPGPRRDRSPPRRYDDYPASRPHSPPRRRLSPRGSDRDYSSRPRSPAGGAGSERRQRSPSPRGTRPNRDLDDRDRGSATTSRKSSPHVHASRLALVQDTEEPRSGRPSPRRVAPESRHRSPERRNAGSPRRDKDGDVIFESEEPAQVPSKPREPPSGPSAERAPPTGPGSRTFIAPPSGPRGDAAPSRGGFAPRGRGGYNADFPAGPGRSSISATFRGGRGGAPAFSRGPYDREAVDNAPRPAVSRATSISQRFDTPSSSSYDERPIPSGDSYRRPPAGPGVAPSGPASERLVREPRADTVHQALRGLPETIPNGKKIPPVADHSRLNKLEDETERLRKIVQERDARKRKNLREWDRLVREGQIAFTRTQLAEESMRAFDAEAEVAGAAAF